MATQSFIEHTTFFICPTFRHGVCVFLIVIVICPMFGLTVTVRFSGFRYMTLKFCFFYTTCTASWHPCSINDYVAKHDQFHHTVDLSSQFHNFYKEYLWISWMDCLRHACIHFFRYALEFFFSKNFSWNLSMNSF